MNRRTLLQATAAVPFAAALASRQGSAQSTSESLSFDATAFTVETKTVTTAAGDIEVTYNSWPATLYVANPVDATYQSLTVKQPTALNGVAIDSSSAPILLDIPVGGYMSAAVDGGSTARMTTGTMQMNGTPAAGQMGEMPSGTPDASGDPQMGGNRGAMTGALGSQGSGNAELALAAGFVVVRPGVRGRDNQADDGTWFGKAAAAIVDLKSAVRYIRANNGSLPGNAEMIISTGTSAGGALSTLLGASGDSDLYADYLSESGAAEASDAIFAVAAYCPITDLDHADGAYEWMFGAAPTGGAEVDPDVSAALAAQFEEYLPSLALTGSDGTVLDTTNYADHLLTTFLRPAASTWLASQDDATRTAYLAENGWMEWDGTTATFSLEDFVGHIARKKGAPAFDAFDLSAAENSLFGDETTAARHFTEYSLRTAAGDDALELDADLPDKITMMNPMHFILAANEGRVRNWFLRVGTSDMDTSPSVVTNLAAACAQQSDVVDAPM